MSAYNPEGQTFYYIGDFIFAVNVTSGDLGKLPFLDIFAMMMYVYDYFFLYLKILIM